MKTIKFIVAIITLSTITMLAGCGKESGPVTASNTKVGLKVVFGNTSSSSSATNSLGAVSILLNIIPANPSITLPSSSANIDLTPYLISGQVPAITLPDPVSPKTHEPYLFRITAWSSSNKIIYCGQAGVGITAGNNTINLTAYSLNGFDSAAGTYIISSSDGTTASLTVSGSNGIGTGMSTGGSLVMAYLAPNSSGNFDVAFGAKSSNNTLNSFGVDGGINAGNGSGSGTAVDYNTGSTITWSCTRQSTSSTNTSSGTATQTTTPTLSSIAVSPANTSKTVGATQQFTATGTYSDNSTADLTATVTWSSTSTTVATIATTGIATAVVTGSTTITATLPVTLPIPGSISGTTTLTVTSAVVTPSITLPKTGQTLCYDAAGAVIACTGTGQDGALQKGIAWPVPRFVDNADGTVTDNLTGLIWTKNAACIVQQWYGSWLQANSVANGLCGLTDGSTAAQWRLPNRKEMQSLMELPPGHPFTNVQASGYWTSTTVSGSPSSAWIVDPSSGWVYSFGKTNGVNYVWPVKAGL